LFFWRWVGVLEFGGNSLAFTFSGAASRFDARRQLIVQEANSIGTAYLRLDLLPPAAQPELREDFRRYLDSRLAFYEKLTEDLDAARAELAHTKELQGIIWTSAVAACRNAEVPGTPSLVLSSLNEMIDITTAREVALETHPPFAINWTLLLLVLASSLLAGYDLADVKSRSWLHMLVYAAALSAAVYIILDYEYPRLGMIRIDAVDRLLIELRHSMK
jgi:hypothetical protein